MNGAGLLTGEGKAIVLMSASALDENSLGAPTKVAPKTEPVKFSGTAVTRVLPGNSLTIIRIKASVKNK